MLTSLVSIVVSCNGRPTVGAQLDEAESLMEMKPDSALTILSSIDEVKLRSKNEKARYALLMSMALDKNYIDTTAFDVIQPAIDYYLANGKGSPDDRLRTYYYQGRIFENKGDRDNAISTFAKALDNTHGVMDSLCIARTLVAQGALYTDFYDFESYINNYLRAAKIYKKYKYNYYEFDCLLNILNGANLLNNEALADSILNLCTSFHDIDEVQRQSLNIYKLSYVAKHGSKSELAEILSKQNSGTNNDPRLRLNLALAYHRFGENEKAKLYLDSVYESGVKFDTLKYLAISVTVLRDLKDFEGAFSNYWDFSKKEEAINSTKFEQKSKSIEEKHELQLKAQEVERQKSQILWGSVGGIIILVLVIGVLFLLFRSNRNQKDLALQKVKTSELENKQLKSEKDLAIQKAKVKDLENEKLKSESEKLTLEKNKLALENRNLQLERDKKVLEAENLAHRVETLENESESLKNLIANPSEEIPAEVQSAIKVRIEMLNSLLAGYITANAQYEKPYDVWVKELTENTEEFMNSNRLAFQVSHPRFIQYFEEHDLTADEINYVCLYAIGLRGKEVGNYMKKRSHVNISSAIRKKLGIDKHETNIGIYVRKLLKSL